MMCDLFFSDFHTFLEQHKSTWEGWLNVRNAQNVSKYLGKRVGIFTAYATPVFDEIDLIF